jgi:hypothetical protein
MRSHQSEGMVPTASAMTVFEVKTSSHLKGMSSNCYNLHSFSH